MTVTSSRTPVRDRRQTGYNMGAEMTPKCMRGEQRKSRPGYAELHFSLFKNIFNLHAPRMVHIS
jgi:hypothetical protein